MAKIFVSFFLLAMATIGSAQSTRIDDILKNREIKIDYYEMAEAGSWVLYLPMEFGKSAFTYSQQEAINKLKNADIARVDLVYSDYPAGQDFGPLNKKRFEALQKLLPKVFNNSGIEFRKTRQTIAKTKKTAQGLQHGFFIYFRPKPTKEETAGEIKRLKEITEAGLPAGSISDKIESTDSSTYKKWCGIVWVVVDTTAILDSFLYSSWDGNIWIPADAPKTVTKWSVKDYIKKKVDPPIDPGEYAGWDSVYRLEYEKCPDYATDVFIYQVVDSTVSVVFKRHTWKGGMVIADVTGSMYPYTGQLLKWLKLTLTDKIKRYFVFFNDGDSKDDKDKIIGSTGGVYSVLTNKYDEVEELITKAMTNGSGGDAPENNVEALLESDKLCAGCDSVIMIVDNWAPVKDISLLSKSHKPVKVIVCGVFDIINKDYLKLVRETKGSLHLMEEDIYNLSEIKEGETIKIKGMTYKLIKGDFVSMGSLSL